MLNVQSMLRPLLVTLLLMGPVGVPAIAAQEVDVPVSIHIPILLKVLAFDRQLRLHVPKEIVVGVAFQSGNRNSARIKDEAVLALQGARIDLEGATLRVIAIDLDGDVWPAILAVGSVTHLYLTPLRAVSVAALVAKTREVHVLTLSGVPQYVNDGVALGVAVRGGRPRVLVNLEAARLEGADLSAELLKLAEIVR